MADKLDDAIDKAIDDTEGFVDMKRSKSEIKRERTEVAPANDYPVDQYPWGLEIRLESESLEKLGIKKLPSVGTKMTVTAIANVESAHESQTVRGDKKETRRDITLQITKMKLSKGKA